MKSFFLVFVCLVVQVCAAQKVAITFDDLPLNGDLAPGVSRVQIARDVASVADLQMRMQGIVLLGAFLKLTPYGTESQMSDEQVHAGVEKALRKYFGKRGERVVQDNLTCVKRGYSEIREVPQAIMQEMANV